MEKIINSVCNIAIDSDYKRFSESVYFFNNKAIDNETEELNNSYNLNEVYDEILIITDENVYKHQYEKFIKDINIKKLHKYIVPSGEDSKSLTIYEQIMSYCIEKKLSRKSAIIALGGGVVGDLAGFVASTYMRGIDVIQVPTTLLAQVDSSIGGKTGINIGTFKNIVGSFYQPKFTYINVNSLQTLSNEEFISGMAEVIKYAVIYDYEFLNYLIENSENILNKESDYLYYIVKKCASIKAEVVSKDEKEGGLRKILNFGHTFGHGVEKLCKISHGYAVSIGMNMAFKLSLDEKIISRDYYESFTRVCELYDLPLEFKLSYENLDVLNRKTDIKYVNNKYTKSKEELSKEILHIMKSDKKNSFGKINLILPTKEGQVEVIDTTKEEKILSIIKESNNA